MFKLTHGKQSYQVIINLCKKHGKPTGYGIAQGMCVECIEEINREFHKR